MFTIDFTKPWLYKDIVYFNQGNLSSNNILRCKVVTGGDVSLKDYIGEVTFVTLSRKEINGVCKIIDDKNCIIDIYFPSNALEVGENTLEIILTKGSGSNKVVAQSPVIKYKVWQGITTGNGVQGDNNYPILIDLISSVNNVVRVANNASATANASLKQTAKMLEDVDNALVKANNTINATNNAKNEALEAVKDVKNAIAAGTQDLEVKNARGKYPNLNERLDNLDKDLLNVKDTAIIPITTEKSFETIYETVNGYLTDFKLEGKTLIVNSENEEVEAGIEGATLKSIGDDVDEIVVSSVNDNLAYNLANVKPTDGVTPGIDSISFDAVKLEVGKTYTIQSSASGALYYGGANCGRINANEEKTFILPSPTRPNDKKPLSIYKSNGDLTINDKTYVKLSLGSKVAKSLINKQDKKKLLYYDTETQTWKKPILREWDSIEEYSDGMYRYYKKSDEIKLIGNEYWKVFGDAPTSDINFIFERNIPCKTWRVICDKFKTATRGISNSCRVQQGDGTIEITIPKSFLESEDVEGFKKWLQNNNVSIVYQLAQEKVYECIPVDLIAYEGGTNYMIDCGSITPKTTFKCVSFIGNVINTLKEKVSYLEDKLYKTNLANFTVALNALDTKLKLEQLTKTPK